MNYYTKQEQHLPLITPQMYRECPDQVVDILNRLIRFYEQYRDDSYQAITQTTVNVTTTDNVINGIQTDITNIHGDVNNIDNQLVTINADLASLSTVAHTGDYNDLLNIPPAAAVNNGKLTIQKNSTNVAEFTANNLGDVTANITVPTSFSDLTGTASSSQIADGAVTNAKVANNTLDVGKINWSTITAITSASTIFDSTSYTVSSFKAYKVGRIFILERLQFASHQSTISGRQVATLKSAYRPTNNVRIALQHGSNEDVHLGLVQSDGKLIEYAPNNVNQDSIWYSGVWICPS